MKRVFKLYSKSGSLLFISIPCILMLCSIHDSHSRHYEPTKVKDVDTLLTKYAGKEENLFKALSKKYGPEPEPEPEEGGGGDDDDEEDDNEEEENEGHDEGAAEKPTKLSYEESLRVMFKERLVAFYKYYEPTKVKDIDALLTKYAGKEENLLKALSKKYGPEPEPEDDEDDNDEDDDDEEEDKPEVKKTMKKRDVSKKVEKKVLAPKKKGPLTFEERLTIFYNKYDPSKLGGLAKIMKKYSGAENQLFDLLIKKYGPEPKDDEGEEEEEEDDDEEEEEEEEEEEDDEDDDEDEEEEEVDSAGSVVQPNIAPGRGGGGGDNEEAASEGNTKLKTVVYCGVCGLPPEYCKWGPADPALCEAWLVKNHPNLLSNDLDNLNLNDKDDAADGSKKSKKSKRGGQGPKKKLLVAEDDQRINITFSSRGGKKVVMHIAGMDKFTLKGDMRLKDAAKALGKRFACSTAVKDTPSLDKEIQVQGDCRYEITDVLESLFGIHPSKVSIDEESGKKKVKEPKALPPQPGFGDH